MESAVANSRLRHDLVNLSDSEKKQHLRRLIADRDEGQDKDVVQAWLEEAQRCYKELKGGVVKPVPAGEATARARERLGNVP